MMTFVPKLFLILSVSFFVQFSSCTDSSEDDQVTYEWVVKPKGMQCEQPFFDSIEEAKSELEVKAIAVTEFKKVDLIVCAACSVCPTSEHYVMKIKKTDLEQALELGWSEYIPDDTGS